MTKGEILKAIRAYCLGCSCGNYAEVERCVMTNCELYPFRFGKDPQPSKARAEAARRILHCSNAEKKKE